MLFKPLSRIRMGKRSLWKGIFAAAFAVALAAPQHAGMEPIPLRGVVEGFYGTPWNQEARMDILSFCAAHGMNAYIYAPKDDPYHRAKWREPYPARKLEELKALAASANAQGVRFIFAVSPGLDLHFDGAKAERDRECMKEKLTALYDAGVRDFAIFFDDINEKDGKGQADFLNWVAEHFIDEHPDIHPLIMVPTEYSYDNMVDEHGQRNVYTKDLSEHLREDILVVYTGDRVVGDGLPDGDYQAGSALYRRPLGIWWNYPVTDYMESKLALGPVEKLPAHSDVPAIFFNPMKYEHLSKIALATGADYAREPEAYDSDASWRRQIDAQYGALGTDMLRFADQSQHMENSWAKCGRPDGPELRAQMDAFWSAWKGNGDVNETSRALDRELAALEESCKNLQEELPENIRKECLPQLRQMQRIAEADRIGLGLLQRLRAGESPDASEKKTFSKNCREVRKHDKEALISEKTARAFLDELEAEIKLHVR